MSTHKNCKKVVDLQKAIGDRTSRKSLVSNYDYEKFETYVRSSSLSLYVVEALGNLHLNVYKSTGDVERCNRLALLSSLGGYTEIKRYTYLIDHDALNPPKVGAIVDARLHFIHCDKDNPNNEYYWAESITPINEDAEINFVDPD